MSNKVLSWLKFNENMEEEKKECCADCHHEPCTCDKEDKKEEGNEEANESIVEDIQIQESTTVLGWLQFNEQLELIEEKKMKAEEKKEKKKKEKAPKKEKGEEKEGGKKKLSAAQMKLPWNKNKKEE